MSDIRSVLNTQAFSLAENTDGSPDPIRNSINSYWDYNGDTLIYDTGNSYDSSDDTANTFSLNFDITADPSSEAAPIKLDEDTLITMRTYKQRVSITPRYPSEAEAVGEKNSGGRIKVDPETQFDSYIENSIIPSIGIPFSEFKLDLDSPLEYTSDVQNFSAIAGTVNFVYNYGLESYENAIEGSLVAESQLNNFYKFDPLDDSLPVFTPLFSFGRTPVPVKVPLTKRNVSSKLGKSPIIEEDIQDFFMNKAGFIEALGMQEKKDTFPFYNEVYLTTPPRKNSVDKLEESLQDSGLILAFCDLMNREDIKATRDGESQTIINGAFINSYLETSYTDATQQQFKEQNAVRISDIKLYDILAMLKTMHDIIPRKEKATKKGSSETEPVVDLSTSSLRSKAFLTDGEQAQYRLDTISKMKPDTNSVIDYQNALDDFVEEINNLITNVDNFKRYRQVLEGTMTPYQSDVLFYRIKKFEQGSDTPIQNFWIPAEKGYRGVRYIDTQVKYGKMYRYEVCAFKMVLGSDYLFSERDTGVINFDEDLQNFIDESQENLENLIGLSLIKPSIEQAAAEQAAVLPASLGFSTLNVDELVAVTVADFIEERNILDSDLVKVDGYTTISMFADQVTNRIIDTDTATYRTKTIRVDQLTDEEIEKLRVIDSSWKCITNYNKTEPNKLAEIEILINKVVALGNIKEQITKAYDKKEKKQDLADIFKKIAIATAVVLSGALTFGVAAGTYLATGLLAVGVAGASGALTGLVGNSLGGSSKRINKGGITSGDLNLNELEDLYTDIENLRNETRAPLSKYTGGEYGIDLDDPITFNGSAPGLPEDFTVIGRREVLPLSEFGERGDKSRSEFREEKRYGIELVESIFELRANQLATLVTEYMGCYQDFIEAASDFNVVLDYKRINKYNLQVLLQPALKFAEMPYYSSEGMILDNPPIYPNVNVVTYRGAADRLSFFMNSGQGQIEIEPISFSDEEDTFITNYRKSRKLNDFQPFLYKSDERENLGTIFEIRRLNERPQDYQSFREAKVLTTTEIISTGKALPAATFNEEINSNTKYYYIFRVSDRRGAISYPSRVMEIEIVENNGIIYPIIKPYEFEKPKTNTTKSLKRLLNIVPRITQVVPPADTASYDGLFAGPTTILGREEEGLFGKQFKLRLTSKQTGKVVDLNVDFNATVVERSEAE